jgi:sulfur carrier protein
LSAFSAWDLKLAPIAFRTMVELGGGSDVKTTLWCRIWRPLNQPDAANSLMIQITVNGEAKEIPAETTAQGLIELLGLEGRLAMEVNEEIVPRSGFERHALEPGDRVEIVKAIGGG